MPSKQTEKKMITYDPKTKTISMSLVDLENCGFDTDLLAWELWMRGIQIDLAEPETILVDMTASILEAVKT